MRTRLLKSLFLILFLPFAMVAQDCFEDQPPAGSTCGSAKFLCGNVFQDYVDILSSDPPEDPQPEDLCNSSGDVDNIEWYSFIPCETEVELLITPISCIAGLSSQFGLQAGVYEDCTFLNALFCYSAPGITPISITLTDLVPGTIYYLFVDGYAGSICEYKFNVISGIDTSVPEQPEDVVVDIAASNESICEGDQVKASFSVPELNIGGFSCGDITTEDLSYVACFDWEVTGVPVDPAISLEDAYDLVSGEYTACAEMVFYNAGTYQITTNAEFNPAVFDGLGACTVADVTFNTITVVVVPQVLQVEQEIVLCQGQDYEYCDSIYTANAVVQCEVGCTTFVQSIVFNPSTITDLGSFFICNSECFEFQSVQYCDAGFFEVEDENDCTVRFSFTISNLNASIDYGGEDEVNCDIEAIILNPIYTLNNNSTLNYQWADESNTLLGNNSTLEINSAGTYTVVVTADDIAAECLLTHSILITENSDVPQLTILPPIITCSNPIGTISVLSDIAVQSASWTGLGILEPNVTSPMVNEIGMYTVTITGINGCVTIEDVDVAGDLNEPTVLLEYRDIDCNILVVDASYTADVGIITQQWSGPGIASDEASITITQAGNYSLTVIGFNGCMTTETFVVNNIMDWPVVDAGPDLLWNCNTQSLQIVASVPIGSEFQYEWNLINGDPFTAMGDDRIEANSVGEYEIVVTNTNLGCVTRDTVAITENKDVPTAFVGEVVDPVCFYTDNGFIMIESITGGAAPYTLTIDNNPIILSEELNDLSYGTYDLSITDDNGCNYSEEIILTKPLEIILDAPAAIEIKYYETGSLMIEYSVDDGDIAEINWYNGQGELIGQGKSIEFNEQRNSIYTVELITNDECNVSQKIEIRVDTSADVYVPNIFSPNGDGSNDLFWIHGEDNDIMIESLLIYDRWGSLVYEAEDMPVGESSRGWDGTFNGQDVNPGVYIYVLEIRTAVDELLVKSGDITVVR